MRTVTFKSVLHRAAHLMGWDPTTADLTDERAARCAEAIQDRCREGWQWAFWPEWTILEERAMRTVWDSTATYQIGDEVFYDGDSNYYTALTVSTGQQPDISTTDWELTSDLDKYVPWDLAGCTPIDAVKSVACRNPRKTRYPGYLTHEPSERGVQLTDLAPAQVWLEFRTRPPKFSATAWDGAATYAAGDVVYLEDMGECYLALQESTNEDPATETDYWTKQDLPEILASFVALAVYSDLLRDEGQQAKANTEEGRAYGQLAQTEETVFEQQGNITRAQVRAYGS